VTRAFAGPEPTLYMGMKY